MGWDPLPSAVIFPHAYFSQLESTLKTQTVIDMLDYGCLEGDWWHFRFFDACLAQAKTVQFLKGVSRQQSVPLLYYFNMTDFEGYEVDESGVTYACDIEGWGYRIFEKGEEVASTFFDYRIPNWNENFSDHLRASIATSNIDAFRCLGLSDETIVAIKSLLSLDVLIDRLEDDELIDVAAEFQTLLEINSVFAH